MGKKLGLQVLVAILPMLSGTIKKALAELVDSLEEKAKKTDNELDDILVGILKGLLAEGEDCGEEVRVTGSGGDSVDSFTRGDSEANS